MAIRQSASEGRALTISVSARFPLGPVICPDQLEQAPTFAARHLQRYQFRLYRQPARRNADMERPRATDLLVQRLHLPGALGRKHALQLKLCVG